LEEAIQQFWYIGRCYLLITITLLIQRSARENANALTSIEKSAVEAGHRDVRRPEQRRSGGTGSSSGDS